MLRSVATILGKSSGKCQGHQAKQRLAKVQYRVGNDLEHELGHMHAEQGVVHAACTCRSKSVGTGGTSRSASCSKMSNFMMKHPKKASGTFFRR